MNNKPVDRRTPLPAPLPTDEADRMAALERTELLDTPPAEAFQRVVNSVAELLRVPLALISLVDSERQWFLARFGLQISEMPREQSMASHVVASGQALHVSDARADPRFAGCLLVRREPWMRAYLGKPLRSAEGHVLGTLSVMDRRVREFSLPERLILRRYARALEQLLRR